METLRQDLRHTFRMLIKNPTLTAVLLGSLAVGIGANVTVFTAVNAVFMAALPAEDPRSLVTLFTHDENLSGGRLPDLLPVSRLNVEDYRDRSDVFTGVVLGTNVEAALMSGEGDPEILEGYLVSGGYFDVLGLKAHHGRTFLPEEDATPGSHPVVVLSYGLWRRRFGADPAVVGEEIRLSGRSFTVIGVAPRGFRGTFVLDDPDFWVPTMMYETFLTGASRRWWDSRRALVFPVCFARLRPGVDLEQARAAVALVDHALEQEYPDDNKGRGLVLEPMTQVTISPGLRDNFVRTARIVLLAAGLVLLIACTNVASLLVGRATVRRREIAVRLSLGAARPRLLRQLATESLVLAGLGGALGLLLAWWGCVALWATRPPFMQDMVLDLRFDARVLGFTLILTFATALFFGLVPAVRATRPDLATAIKERADAPRRRSAPRPASLLVIGQVALSLLALVGSGLFLRNQTAAQDLDLGFDSEQLVTMNFDVGAQDFDPVRGEQFFDRAVRRAAAVPGVISAGLSSAVPLYRRDFRRTVFIDGRPRDAEGNGIPVAASSVGPSYFETVGIALLRGRGLEPSDRQGSVLVAVINEAMAEQFWPGEDALGRHFEFVREDGVTRQVVGLVRDSKYSLLDEEPRPLIYLPRKQVYRDSMALFLRVDPEQAREVLEQTRREIQRLESGLAISDALTMTEVVDEFLWTPRAMAGLLGGFGLLALLLAAVGVYGVMSHAVSRRRREIAVRMALGARRQAVTGLVCRQGMVPVVFGLGLGLAVARVLTFYYRDLLLEFLYTAELWDWTFAVLSVLLVVAVALPANLVPARRAALTDPVHVLREE